MGTTDARGSGHRVVPHTADVIIEAWAPTRADCLVEAVRALVGTFAEVSAAPVVDTVSARIAGGDDVDVLVALLEEVLYVLDVHERIPVTADVRDAPDGGLHTEFRVAALSQVEVTGPAPKGIVGSRLAPADGSWTCRATIDV